MQTTHEIEIHDKLAHDQCSSILKSNTVHTSYLQKLQMTVFKVQNGGIIPSGRGLKNKSV